MNRRFHFLLLLLGVLAPLRESQAAERSSVVFLVIDDLNTWLLSNPDRYTGKVIPAIFDCRGFSA